MRSILEQAVLHHLNGEDDRASELFHQFIVSRARQIHESMRNGDETLTEGWEETVSEEYFGGDELTELEDGGGAGLGDEEEITFDDEGGEDDAEAELDGDMGADAELDGDAAGDDEFEFDGEGEGGDVSAEEIDALRAELEALTAEFKDLKAEVSGDEVEGDDEFADMSAEPGVEDDLDGADMAANDEEDEEPFQAMGESITSELDKVDVSLKADGKEIGTGAAFAQQRKSSLPQKKGDARQGGKPVVIDAKEHKHFNRETAPSVTGMKPRRNTLGKSSDTLSPVKK